MRKNAIKAALSRSNKNVTYLGNFQEQVSSLPGVPLDCSWTGVRLKQDGLKGCGGFPMNPETNIKNL